MPYSQLTHGKRCHIEALNASGVTQAEIAKRTGVSQSTISRELSRNRPASLSCGYRADLAPSPPAASHQAVRVGGSGEPAH